MIIQPARPLFSPAVPVRAASSSEGAPRDEVAGPGLAGATRLLTRPETGSPLASWRVELGQGYFYSSERYAGPAPILQEGRIYVGDTRSYRQLSTADGSQGWKIELDPQESFKAGDPIIAGRQGELICLKYNFELSSATSRDGYIGIDARSGQVRFKTRTHHPHTPPQTDARGNLYYGTFSGRIVKIDPVTGDETVLNRTSPTDNILQHSVRPDGVIWYSGTVAREVRRLDGAEEKVIPLRGIMAAYGSAQMTPDGGLLCLSRSFDDKEQYLTSISPEGEFRWCEKVGEGECRYTVSADGGAVVLQVGSQERPAELRRFGPDGQPGWTFKLEDPELHSGWYWGNAWMQGRPNGDTLVIEKDAAKIVCLGPDGREKWRRQPEAFPHSAYWPQFSFTPQEKLHIVNRGGLERLDLLTGRRELQYCNQRGFLRRWNESGEVTVDRPLLPEKLHLSGLAIQGEGDRIYSFDRQAAFLAVDLCERGPAVPEVAPAGQIGELKGYLNVGGVLVPRRRPRA